MQHNIFRKIITFVVLCAFLISNTGTGFAQMASTMPWMPTPGTSVTLSAAFTPAHLTGMVINPTDPFKFDFMIHRGDQQLSQDQKQAEYTKLIKYFLAALAVPDTDQWVNLSPYEQDRIIPDTFGLTEMGRDLLAQDYLLKQLSASLTDPDSALGQKFWDGVYAAAYQKFGSTDIPTDTFNKVWITPDKAVVYEKNNSVVVLENHLKVMLESDYKAMKENANSLETDDQTVQISKQVMREVIIPAIEKEVNEGKSFAPLRQVYSGMLLATWYKIALKGSILGELYADKGKVQGVNQDDPKTNQEIYTKYVEAFQKGVFNLIKEDVDRYSQEVIPRKYFSGGALQKYAKLLQRTDKSQAQERINSLNSSLDFAMTKLNPSDDAIANITSVDDLKNFIDKNPKQALTGQVLYGSKSGLTLDGKPTFHYGPIRVSAKEIALTLNTAKKITHIRVTNNFGDIITIPADLFIKYVTPENPDYWTNLDKFDPAMTGTPHISSTMKAWHYVKTRGILVAASLALFIATIITFPSATIAGASSAVPTTKAGVDMGLNVNEKSLTKNNDLDILKKKILTGVSTGQAQEPIRNYKLTLPESADYKRLPDEFEKIGFIRTDPTDNNTYKKHALNKAVATIIVRGGTLFLRDLTEKDYKAVAEALQKTRRDQAMVKDETDNAMNGGIDFAQSNLDMQIKRDGAGVPLPVSQQNLENIRINGLVPVILEIRSGIGVASLF